MPSEFADRELLIAAKAVELQLISAESMANAVAGWTTAGSGSLFSFLEASRGLDDDKRGKLRELFDEHEDLFATEVPESFDDSLFGKLNNALANVEADDLIAGTAAWQNPDSRLPLHQVSENSRFEVISEHARGGLGEVLVAADHQLHRRVALKRIREKWADDEHAKIRFQQEAEITGRLEHPGVVPVYALGQRADGQIYYAMRFIRGESLEAAAKSFHQTLGGQQMDARSPELRDLLRRFVDVCNTMRYAHSRGIIHRDLKPANIMLGNYGETLVVDWGLAKQIGALEAAPISSGAESIIAPESGSGSAPTQFGSAVGTPQYMSPEQATGRLDRMGPGTDVFGLGATLYHVLTGKPPQKSDSVKEILERVEYGEFPKPCEVNPNVPRPLEAICIKALELRPTDRYPTPKELGEDIERWLADETVTVCQDSVTLRIVRWVRKHQTLATATAVAMLLLTVGSVVGSFAWTQFERQQLAHDHEQQKQEAEHQQQEQVRIAQLREREQRRLNELRTSLAAATALVQQQIQSGQLAMAVSILEGQIQALSTESEFDQTRTEMEAKADRLKKIVEFYALSEFAQQANYLAQDEDETVAIVEGLDLLGVWEHADWWNHLPSQDVNAGQRDHLKESVYRNLVLLASTYTKRMGIPTLENVGGEISDSVSGRVSAILSKNEITEARAAVVTCDLASRFRPAECLRWYRGIAAFRLLKEREVPANRLQAPRNAVDAYELGVLSLSRHIVKGFPFIAYLDVKDPLMGARETFGIAAEMAPNHYWTQLLLAQSEYLLAERAAERNDPEAWLYYETSRRTFGRCVTNQPQLPFAFADLSTVCAREFEVIGRSQTLSSDDIARNRITLQDSCLRYAHEALDRDPSAGWVYWHYGHALNCADRVDEAMNAYRQAIELGFRFDGESQSPLIDVDSLRGRDNAINITQRHIKDGQDRSVFNAVLAGVHLMAGEYEKARPQVTSACDHSEPDAFAWSCAGALAMHDGNYPQAADRFRTSLQTGGPSYFALMGLALSLEQQEVIDEAGLTFEQAIEFAQSARHHADALLGMCRLRLRLGDDRQAVSLMRDARNVYPSCSLDSVRAMAEQKQKTTVLNAIDRLSPAVTAGIVGNIVIQQTNNVAVHNGDFELSLDHDWLNPGSQVWSVSGKIESSAKIDNEIFHGGEGSLHIATIFADGGTAGTQQTVTVEEDSLYSVSMWVKCDSAEDGSLSVGVVAEGAELTQPAISLLAEPCDWREVEGTFATPQSRQSKGLVPMTLHIESHAPAQIWIDNLAITRLSDSAAKTVDAE